MIYLHEVATKLSGILNGTDTEAVGVRPTDYEFFVATNGFHIDSIANYNTGKNFIPVFISSMGGQYNPVPNLEQAEYVLPISIYFPVRFKEDFFVLNEYLVANFVGRVLTYGLNKKAVSNITVAQYGEIQNLDLKEFKEWVQQTYLMEKDIGEPYMSMSFNLHLSTGGASLVWGNETQLTISTNVLFLTTGEQVLFRNESLDEEDIGYTYYGWGNGTYTRTITATTGTNTYKKQSGFFVIDATGDITNEPLTDEPLVNGTSVQSQSEPVGQQIMGETESQGLPVNTSYSSGFTVYYKKNNFYRYIINEWFKGKCQDLVFDYNLTFDGITYKRTCYIQSVNLNIQKGSLATITFAFVRKVE